MSLSLPFNPHNEPNKGPAVEHCFDNLLPDILRMMLTKAVGNGSFSIDMTDDQRTEQERERSAA